jgi:hypothetical protein
MTKPILMAVLEHPRELATLQRELLGRYAADYEVIAEASATAALERLEALRAMVSTIGPAHENVDWLLGDFRATPTAWFPRPTALEVTGVNRPAAHA